MRDDASAEVERAEEAVGGDASDDVAGRASEVVDAQPVADADAARSQTDTPAVAGPKRFPCRQCGAKLTYSPGAAKLVCDYCGFENAIPQSAAEIRELDFEQALARLADERPTEARTTVHCDACGAEFDAPEQMTALACPFCGSNIISGAESRRRIRPEAILPFRIPRQEARARFLNWLRRLWFAPSALKKYARLESRLAGIYLPHWTYDAETITHYTGQRGEHYWVTVGSGKYRRRVRRTRWYPASGVVFNSFNDVLVIASQSLPDKYVERLEPWGLTELEPHQDAYLSGYQAETYTVDLVQGFARAQRKMKPIIEQTVRYDIGGDVQRVLSMHTQYDNVRFKLILLPIWISAYRFREKVYRFLVNGRSGEVQGERPYSWVKIMLAVLLAGIGVAVGVWLLARAGVFESLLRAW